eukprot:2227525-Rhodomonas_salina.3
MGGARARLRYAPMQGFGIAVVHDPIADRDRVYPPRADWYAPTHPLCRVRYWPTACCYASAMPDSLLT